MIDINLAPVNVLSLGAGVQSSALLMLYLEGKLKPMPDFAVFADTQAEPVRVYEWLKKLQAKAEGKCEIIIGTKGDIIADFYKANESGRWASMPFFVRNPDGSVGISKRQCTYDYKIMVVQQEVRKKLGYKYRQRMKHQINMIIGISMDEVQRMKDARDKWQTNVYPLIDELEWERHQCYDYLKTVMGEMPPKSSCYVCPYRSNESWKQLKRSEPDCFEKACKFDDDLRARGRVAEGCAEYDKR